MTMLPANTLLAKSLVKEGIHMVFTTGAKSLSPIVEALEEEREITVFHAKSDTAAAIMADGYIRKSRKLAAVLTDSLGNALYQVCGVTNAWADKVPLVSISLCRDAPYAGNQTIDRCGFNQTAAFAPVTLYQNRVNSCEDIPHVLAEAVLRFLGSPMGPVHIDIPEGFFRQKASIQVNDSPVTRRSGEIIPLRVSPDKALVIHAMNRIQSAKRPLVIAGGGVHASMAYREMVTFLESLQIPVATTMAGIGTIPANHPLCIGPPSYTAGEAFHAAISEADVVLGLGAGFGGLEGFGSPPLWSKRIRFIQVDSSIERFGLNIKPEISICGDIQTTLSAMNELVRENRIEPRGEWKTWHRYLHRLKTDRIKRLAALAMEDWNILHQGRLAMEIGKIMQEEDLVMVIDGGNTPLYAAMYAPEIGPGRAFFPFGMAALGGGIPYAMGVQMAAPHKQVVLVSGDGSLLYNVQELETITRIGLPIIIFVNNDSAWNMIRAMQVSLFENHILGTDIPETDYAEIANGFGFFTQRVEKPEDILPAYQEAKQTKGPALIDCITDNRNIPDALLSFTLVEFEGCLRGLDPVKVMKSQWLMREMGKKRQNHMLQYIRKALFRINFSATREKRGRRA